MNDEVYFFDTYAVVEILNQNKDYIKYINKVAVLTKLNIFEIFYSAARDHGNKKAKEVIDKYYLSVVDYDRQIIEEAANFRQEHKKRNLSMADCIGYIIAKRLHIKFLTGDKEFSDIDNVEFVK